MDDKVVVTLLNGMPLHEFKSWLILAMAGALLYLIIRIIWVLGPVGDTPPKWSWKAFAKGFLKLLITLIISPWFILYFEDVMPLLLKFVFELGDSGGEIQKLTAEINGVSAFLIGFSIDFIYHKVTKKFFKKA